MKSNEIPQEFESLFSTSVIDLQLWNGPLGLFTTDIARNLRKKGENMVSDYSVTTYSMPYLIYFSNLTSLFITLSFSD